MVNGIGGLKMGILGYKPFEIGMLGYGSFEIGMFGIPGPSLRHPYICAIRFWDFLNFVLFKNNLDNGRWAQINVKLLHYIIGKGHMLIWSENSLGLE